MNFNLELKREEEASISLRSLYRKFGYCQYKMSKFEEYDLYAGNKNFLVSDSVITFTDTNGKLLALKPDVTLSIIKNTKDEDGLNKVYYNENVYRVSNSAHSYKEIMQVGLECIGNIDLYNISEVISLAAQSLLLVSGDSVLDLSNMGIVASLLEKFKLPSKLEKEVLSLIGEKNVHEATRLLMGEGIDAEKIENLKKLISLHGSPAQVLPELKKIAPESEALSDLSALCEILEGSDEGKIINVDFSVIGDMSYYNGFVFKGFVKGVPSSVLSGGQYDNLMSKMNKKSGAIGFAVYLDLLENLSNSASEYDCDILVIYDNESDLKALSAFVREKAEEGKIVKAEKEIPLKLKAKEIYKFARGEVQKIEKLS